MAFASMQKTGTRKVMKLMEVEVPVEHVTLTMTKREAAYVYVILGKVSNNEREWRGGNYHPVFNALVSVFNDTKKPNTGSGRFNYESLPLEAQDWVASQ